MPHILAGPQLFVRRDSDVIIRIPSSLHPSQLFDYY